MNELKSSSPLVSAARKEGDALVASIAGEIDLNSSPMLRTAMLDLVNQARPVRIVLNLSAVPYMDSSAIAVMVELLRKVLPKGKMYLTNLQPRVKNILEIARLITIFSVSASEADALAAK